jgi:DNA topoisomerase-3
MDVYEAIHDADVANVELTARWEMALEEIATKGVQASVFLNNIKGFTRRITSEIISSEGVSNIRQKLSAFIPDCPKCGAKLGLLEQSAWCESCNWTLWRNVGGKRLSDEVIREVLKKDENGKINGKTSLLSGFRSRDGREFSAIVEIDDDGRTRLVYPDTGKSLQITCPLCKKEMTVSNRSVSCSCGLNVWRKVYGITLTDAQMKKLLTKGRSGLITLITKDGKKYKADLELQRDGSLVRIYENKNKNK